MKKYDIAVIGAGPGGSAAAKTAVQLGAKTVLIEKAHIGGVCLNYGCIPTKAILASVKLIHQINQADDFGLSAKIAAIQYHKIVQKKNDIVTTLRSGMSSGYSRNGIVLIQGAAHFKSTHVIRVQEEGKEVEIKAEKVIVATGSRSLELPLLPFDNKNVLDSKAMLALEELPRTLLIVGGGAIGCEFATLARTFGVDVTIVEMMAHLLPAEDSELGKRLGAAFKKQGITVLTNDKIISAEVQPYGVCAKTEKNKSIQCEKVLVAVGRKRVADSCNLSAIDVALNNDRVVVNDYLETNISGVYAVGDILATPLLAHVAMHEGRIAAYNAVKGNAHTIDYDTIPNCIFTLPEIASVGLTREQALKRGIAVEVSKELFSASGKAYCDRDTEGFIKLVFDNQTKQILGGQIMGHSASELIAEIALAVKYKITIDELSQIMHQHPTLAEGIQDAALTAIGSMNHKKGSS
ncbi:MAG: dihydrolipoyl dehydrogenase [Candidatus Omnitrophica bacterium]|nr:dihydrolipoyl dehydrogenase [Candidatus Omnitrophota bacterium]